MGRSCNPVPRLDCGDSGRDEPGDDDEETLPACGGEVIPPTGGRVGPGAGWGDGIGTGSRPATCGASRWSEGRCRIVVSKATATASVTAANARRDHSEMRAGGPSSSARTRARRSARGSTIISRTARSMASSSRLSESCLSVIRVSHSGHLLFPEPAVPRKRATSRCRPAHRG